MVLKEGIKSSYIQLFMVFIVIVLLKEVNIIPSYYLNFKLFAYILPFLSIPVLLDLKKSAPSGFSHTGPILLILFTFILSIRLIPYIYTQVPLGYDPGFYKYAIEMYANNLPNIPESTLPEWLKVMFPQGLFVLTDILYIFAGFDAAGFFKILFPFLCALLILPVFILTRDLFDERSATIAALLYALSYTQYTMFTYLYFKNVIGLIFLLLAIFLLERKKYAPLVLMYAALGIYHRPEFLLFSLIMVVYFLHVRDKKLIYVVLATAIMIAPFWLSRLSGNLLMIRNVAGTALTNIQVSQAGGGGTFFGFGTYEWVSLAYLPFGLIGVIYVLLQKKWSGLLFGFLINAAIVVFQLFFFKRLIISLDILLIIFAGAGLNYGFLESKLISKKLASAAVILLLASSGIILLEQVSHARPLVNEDQLEAVRWLALNTEPDAYVLATSYDAPWVLGWSERRVIAPGLFQWNIYNEQKWIEFLRTGDPEIAKEFLEPYNSSNIYVYHSKNRFNQMNLEKFEGSSFETIEWKSVNIYKLNSTSK